MANVHKKTKLRGFLIWVSLFKSDLHKGSNLSWEKHHLPFLRGSSLPNTTRHSVIILPRNLLYLFYLFYLNPRHISTSPLGWNQVKLLNGFLSFENNFFGVGNPYQTWIPKNIEEKKLRLNPKVHSLRHCYIIPLHWLNSPSWRVKGYSTEHPRWNAKQALGYLFSWLCFLGGRSVGVLRLVLLQSPSFGRVVLVMTFILFRWELVDISSQATPHNWNPWHIRSFLEKISQS